MVDVSDFFKKNFLILFLCASCFLFYALILSVKKGYIYGAALLIIVAIISLFKKKFSPLSKEVKKLSLFLLIFALFMGHSFESLISFSNEGDYLSKYLIGAFLVLCAACVTLPPKVLAYSLVTGCFTTAALAVYQFPILGRAEGFTNAIRFGNIAMLMGMLSWIFVFVKKFSFAEKIFLFFGGLAGLMASLLSLSRGGWLIIFLLPLLVMFFARTAVARKKMYLGGVVSLVAVVFLLSAVPVAQQRFAQAHSEVVGYFSDPQKYAMTSVGARLEQWRLSWNLGWEKPLTGWGVKSVEIGRQEYMARGDAHEFMQNINHTHNEFLEMWATRGALGVLALLIFYGLPIFIFWPTNKKINMFSSDNQSMYIGLSVSGLMLTFSYFVFGLTDVFFNLAIGHNFIIFTFVFLVASIEWLKKNDATYCETKNVKI